MKYGVYAYRDIKTSFTAPIVEPNEASAIRGFAYAINSANGLMNYSPNDFSLYHIGEYDADKGILIPEPVPDLVIEGIDVYNGKK